MALHDGEFQPAGGPQTTGSLAARLGAELVGPGDLPIAGVETIERAGPAHLVFVRSSRYAEGWAKSRASAALVGRGVKMPPKEGAALLVVGDVDEALSTVLDLLGPAPAVRPPGRHPTAVVDPSASIASSVCIGPHCVVEAGAVLEDGVVLVARAFIGRGSRIGAGTVLHPGVTVYERCKIGRGCILHAGVVIGADGFGYRPTAAGLIKVPHIGDVVVGDQVEIGAGSCIDRGKFGSTSIGAGTKIDNLVQVGHNATVGRSVVLCGQVGLAGSCVIGDGALLGGQAGIADHLTVGPMARIGAASGVLEDVPAKSSWLGYPAIPSRDQMRYWAWLRGFSSKTRTEASQTRQAEAAAREAAIPGTARWTLAGSVKLSGTGLFTGEPSLLSIHPAAGGGIQFRVPGGTFPAGVALLAGEGAKLPFPTGVQARNTTLVLGAAGAAATVEHVLSALAGMGVTDAIIEIMGREAPMFDGSAKPFTDAIVDAGLSPLPDRLTPITLDAPITVARGESSITATPREKPGWSVTYVIDYGRAIPKASASWSGNSGEYRREVAWARTFCLASEARAMRERGMFGHLTPKDMLVLDDETGAPVENTLRSPDEPARHKLLDVIGDLALLGRPLQADVVATRSGHALTHELCRAILARAGV